MLPTRTYDGDNNNPHIVSLYITLSIIGPFSKMCSKSPSPHLFHKAGQSFVIYKRVQQLHFCLFFKEKAETFKSSWKGGGRMMFPYDDHHIRIDIHAQMNE